MTEREVIMKQFDDFCLISNYLPEINYYNYPTISNNIIGIKTSKFTMSNYIDRYKEIINSKYYNILFADESIICFYYEFNDYGEIKKYNLSYIPSVDIDINIDDYEFDEETRGLLLDSYMDYLRIDFDDLGYKKIIHVKNHMHIGLNNRSDNNPRNEIRFPLSHIIYPFDFIYIICMYVYHSKSDKVYTDKLFHDNTRRLLLEEDEQRLFCLAFNS
ncbi:DUF2290 domain-containing protein [Tissierella pigra]|uniref:DUF2290 domain-containing protein n=1 Tax=Tissierella pigra TaxID=2607614 RepID=UPI001C123A9C|nr:DUF2290 domain-containing protein [Tissierella pigra]MBU5428435.1 DUF2290 domain-containing protein [Tissierella pigra]